jgi:hypothetical protein
MWDEQWPLTDNQAGDHPEEELDTLDELAPFPGVSGTTDALESTRDAEPYVPPFDPPVLPGGREGIHIATGFGLSPDEEAYEDPTPRGDEDIREEALLALHQDSLTSQYSLDVNVRQGMVYLRGQVPSYEDAEHASALLGNLAGVVDVVDNTTVEPTAEE